MAHTVLQFLCVTLLMSTLSAEKSKEQTRWSRQISSYTADISDWVPLPGPVEREASKPSRQPPRPSQQTPIKRQAIAEPRILTEPLPGFNRPTGFGHEAFPPRTFFQSPSNRQLYLQSVPAVPSAPQNYLTEQGFGQSIRFGLSQPNFPLSQGFVAPQFPFETLPQIQPRPQALPVHPNPIKFENFAKTNLPLSSQAKPFNQPQNKLEAPKFVDGYRVENVSNDFAFASSKKKPQSLQKLKFDNIDKLPKTETIDPNTGKIEREEVQLLYVPVESLNRGQFNFRSPLTTSQLINAELYNQGLPKQTPLKQPFTADFQRPVTKPVENFSFGQNYYNNYNTPLKDFDQTPKFSTVSSPFPVSPPTTPKPKKLKPHQPPLAVFLSEEAKKGNEAKVSDVLSYLKNANTVPVLDSANPLTAPKVFIGPSSLQPPENFVKFELPYLSNIEKSDKKLRQLPFFVAPLSYNTPEGFAKIPFPSPHVGSVVINSQIRESPSPTTQRSPSADVLQNSYSVSQPSYKQVQRVTQKPNVSFYSTSPPKANAPSNYDSNYYSFEPQTVTSIKPPKEPERSIATASPKPDSYFLSNVGNDYNPSQYVSFPAQDNYNTQEPVKAFNVVPLARITTTPRTTVTTRTTTTTTKLASTYPSPLLETHNPYSINQAFHFSTPLDYNNYFDDYKVGYATPGISQPPSPTPASITSTASENRNTPKPTPKAEEIVTEKPKHLVTTEKPKYQSSPNYIQSYTPEIHYQSEISSSRYPIYNSNDFTQKTENSPDNSKPTDFLTNNEHWNLPIGNVNTPVQYNTNFEAQPAEQNFTQTINEIPPTPDSDIHSTHIPNDYNQYDSLYNSNESKETTTSTTITTTTRRQPIRQRGRPRYTTPRSDSNESTRTVVTRRPLRRPLPTRVRYEPNKISVERTTLKAIDASETTTKSTRARTRGRIHYKTSENREYYDNNKKTQRSKENDLAYQRDVLHQNYPVTLMERKSTVDIEAITEPASKTSMKNTDIASDTENAYTNKRISFSQSIPNTETKEEMLTQTEATYIPNISSNEEHFYRPRSSSAPVDDISAYDETSPEKDEYTKETTPIQKPEITEIVPSATEPAAFSNEQNTPNNSAENSSTKQDESTQSTSNEDKGTINEELSSEKEENVVQTTPSYNRVRVRPGVIRQHYQASTDSSRNKIEKRKPLQAITYRPTFSARRTTMRIDEIEADLKTKQIRARPEVQDYRHPVYMPDSTTESFVATTQEITKRGQFRRRRPTYTTSSTEATSTKKNTYEVKNRFRGRRPTTEKPTEKSTEKPEVQTDIASTIKNIAYNRYSHRLRLSERYNKKPDVEESEDQDSNYSINRPTFVAPESEQWSPTVSADSFKPFNPNDISDEKKINTTGKSLKEKNSEPDIITARNEYEDLLISVTPPTNNRVNKKIPDIPPTLEALVEQSKVTKSDSKDAMSTFESMLEEVMKSLEEQDENEYTSTNVMKHKGGEIGEIPPERVITSGENYTQKTTTQEQQETTAVQTKEEDSTLLNKEGKENKSNHRRGVWKKVKVRPVTTEAIETAESQFYTHTVNRLGEIVKDHASVINKSGKHDKAKLPVTTYKPNLQFLKDFFNAEDEQLYKMSTVDIPKIGNKNKNEEKLDSFKTTAVEQTTEFDLEKETPAETSYQSPGDFDFGTGSPDPTVSDYYTTATEPSSKEKSVTTIDRSDSFSLMDYLFGVTSSDHEIQNSSQASLTQKGDFKRESENKNTSKQETERTTELTKPKIVTTESTFMPDEITTVSEETKIVSVTDTDIKQTQQEVIKSTEKSVVRVETSTASSFVNPNNIVSTSMSTEVSHETEICFRGKCIKTSKDIL